MIFGNWISNHRVPIAYFELIFKILFITIVQTSYNMSLSVILLGKEVMSCPDKYFYDCKVCALVDGHYCKLVCVTRMSSFMPKKIQATTMVLP